MIKRFQYRIWLKPLHSELIVDCTKILFFSNKKRLFLFNFLSFIFKLEIRFSVMWVWKMFQNFSSFHIGIVLWHFLYSLLISKYNTSTIRLNHTRNSFPLDKEYGSSLLAHDGMKEIQTKHMRGGFINYTNLKNLE